MTKKTFTWNLKNRKLNHLKAITKKFLNKNYVREFFEESPSSVKIIDNFSNISDILLNKKNEKGYKIGTSLNIKNVNLKHKYWDKLQLNMSFLSVKKEKQLLTQLKIDLITQKKIKSWFNKKNKKK